MTFASSRERMIRAQLEARGISDPRVLEAFRAVPREEFVPPHLRSLAYRDGPLPIGHGQTISQPYIVGLTIQALQLRGGERVLEVGTGSGYEAALLSVIAGEVFSVERVEPLVAAAGEVLARLGYTNVQLRAGDGTLGWPEHAPYAAIAVSASGPEVPRALLGQLGEGARLVMPVGSEYEQMLVRVTRDGTEFRYEELTEVTFVPLIGEQGWPDSDASSREGSSPAHATTTKLL